MMWLVRDLDYLKLIVLEHMCLSCESHVKYSKQSWFFWILEQEVCLEVKELSEKRSWMPEETILSDQVEKLCLFML